MTQWVLRENPMPEWRRIWNASGFQINEAANDGRFLLLDDNMPVGVPASCVMGTFDTFAEAVAHAEKEGPQDWSGWPQ